MVPPPTKSTRPYTLFPYTTLFRSRRRETGFDPAGETVLGGLDIGRDRGIATLSARLDLETERAIDAEVVPVGDKDEGTPVRGRADAGAAGGPHGGGLKPVEALAVGGVGELGATLEPGGAAGAAEGGLG